MIDYRAMDFPPIARLVAALACAALLALPGCGDDGGGGEQSAQDAAQAYVEASNQGDAARVCELYSDQLKRQLAIAGNCEDFVKEHTAGTESTLALAGVQESGDRATARLRATVPENPRSPVPLEIQLQRQDGEWLISGLGAAGVAAGD
jgi:ketosteroid isomerase-like protein